MDLYSGKNFIRELFMCVLFDVRRQKITFRTGEFGVNNTN